MYCAQALYSELVLVSSALVAQLTTDSESPSELSLMGGTRGMHGLTLDNSPNSDLADSGDTGVLLEIRLLKEGRRGICGSAVAVG